METNYDALNLLELKKMIILAGGKMASNEKECSMVIDNPTKPLSKKTAGVQVISYQWVTLAELILLIPYLFNRCLIP